MKNHMVVLGVCAVGLVAVVGAGAVYAHGRFGHGGPGFMQHQLEKRIADAEDFVEATPDQRAIIDGARTSIETKMKAHFEARKAERQAAGNGAPQANPHDLVRMLSQDKIDEQALYAEIDRRADEMKAMAREVVPEIIKAHDALTSAQRQKLAARSEQRREEMRARWQERQGGGRDDSGGFGGSAPQQQ